MRIAEGLHLHVDRMGAALALVAHRTGRRPLPAAAHLEQRGAQGQLQRRQHQRHQFAGRLAGAGTQEARGAFGDVDDVGVGIQQDAGRRQLGRLVQVDFGERKQAPAAWQGRRARSCLRRRTRRCLGSRTGRCPGRRVGRCPG